MAASSSERLEKAWPTASKYIAIVVALTVGAAYFFECLVYTRHLQWLPTTELRQVATLQTENGFYYSYYRELVNAETFVGGLKNIIWDTRSEYPDVLNAIRRFNIFQEISLAFSYRWLRAIGLAGGDAFEFFRFNVYGLNGLGHVALSLLSSEVSGNPFAGILFYIYAVLTRFEISRLGSYPSLNLREQYGVPLLWIQVLCMWHLLRGSDYNNLRMRPPRKKLWFCFIVSTFLFILSWQFSPFMLLLQAASLYFVYLVCGYRGIRHVVVGIINVYIGCIAAAFLVHFASPYLITSPFLYELVGLKLASMLISRKCASLSSSGRGCFRGGAAWLWHRVVDVSEGLLALAVFALVMKAMAPYATADTHVYEILCTKSKDVNSWLPKQMRLSNERLPDCAEPSFNAKLYLIMGVFNVLEESSWNMYRISTSGPASMTACGFILARCIFSLIGRCFGAAGRGRGGAVDEKDAGAIDEKDDTRIRPVDSENIRRRKGGNDDTSKSTRQAAGSGRVDKMSKGSDGDECVGPTMESESSEEAALLFFAIQFAFYFILGMLVNRLRVAFGPPMMVMAAAVFGPRTFPLQSLLVRRSSRAAVLCGIMVLFCLHVFHLWTMLPCIGDDQGICNQIGEKKANDGDLADLMSWVNEAAPPNISVLCSMNLAGTMRAFTSVPMIVHPQFESENLRKRVQQAYELYHCGTEESFAQTMRKLHANVAIFEYARCFFTPYYLDDKRKNCNDKKHKQEDLLCVKLHAKSRFFKTIFINGGYAVMQLRDEPLPHDGTEKTPEVIEKMLEKRSTWKDYMDECQRTQPSCGARLVEAAAVWHHSLKREKAANTIRHLALERYPEDPFVNYAIGRHLDYEAEKADRAGHYYEKAFQLAPNNVGIIKEYLMWIDMVAKDGDKAKKLLLDRKGGKKRKETDPTPFMKMKGGGSYEMLCEAGVSAIQQGMKEYGQSLWDKSVKLAPLGKCLENNWEFLHPGSPYGDTYTQNAKVWHYIKSGAPHEISTHHLPGVRFFGDVNFTLVPKA